MQNSSSPNGAHRPVAQLSVQWHYLSARGQTRRFATHRQSLTSPLRCLFSSRLYDTKVTVPGRIITNEPCTLHSACTALTLKSTLSVSLIPVFLPLTCLFSHTSDHLYCRLTTLTVPHTSLLFCDVLRCRLSWILVGFFCARQVFLSYRILS